MDSHENVRTTARGRLLMIERLQAGWSIAAVAAAFGVCPATVRKWRNRFAAEGAEGLREGNSRPLRRPNRLAPETPAVVEALRRQRLNGPPIARRLGLAVSTVGLERRRLGRGRLRALDPKPAIIRYERESPGELPHMDIRKLGRIDGIGNRITGDRTGQSSKRGTGWDYLYVAIDDASRLAFTANGPTPRLSAAPPSAAAPCAPGSATTTPRGHIQHSREGFRSAASTGPTSLAMTARAEDCSPVDADARTLAAIRDSKQYAKRDTIERDHRIGPPLRLTGARDLSADQSGMCCSGRPSMPWAGWPR
jgi:hypothetical protein